MRSLNSICKARDEARHVSRSWSSSKPVEPVSAVAKYMPDADSQYGSQANKDLWYSLEVRQISDDAKMFTPEIAKLANTGYNKVMGLPQFKHHFTLHSSPEDFLQYIDRSLYTVQYKGELV